MSNEKNYVKLNMMRLGSLRDDMLLLGLGKNIEKLMKKEKSFGRIAMRNLIGLGKNYERGVSRKINV